MLSYLGRAISSDAMQARVTSQLSIYGQLRFPSKMFGKRAPIASEKRVKTCFSINTPMLA